MNNVNELNKYIQEAFTHLVESGKSSFDVTESQIFDIVSKCFEDQFKEDEYSELKMQKFIDENNRYKN